jgi:predicted nucleotidyltransferase
MQRIHGVPEESKFYQFGSSINSLAANDIDIVVVYKASICHPSKVREVYEPVLRVLQRRLPIPLDVTFLTTDEFDKWLEGITLELICVYP